jgi:hypothetical protein
LRLMLLPISQARTLTLTAGCFSRDHDTFVASGVVVLRFVVHADAPNQGRHCN